MNSLWMILQLPQLRSLAGVAGIIALVWYIGPALQYGDFAPFSTERNRVIAALVLIGGWFLYQGLNYLFSWRKNRRMAKELAENEEPDAVAIQTEEELATLSKTFDHALQELKKANIKNLYQLPWYVIIGPPGAGKTTALVNSGLNFPLAKRLGTHKIQGASGTRNCDWWFTDQAVILDTAGRYTTQDSHETIDSAAWDKFLALLKKYRRRRPLNGIIVAISLADLMQQTEAERGDHALTIRKRIQDLYEKLGVTFPIYVLFTKCDLIAGCMEFFDDLGREERGQVWGMTFPLDELNEDGEPVVDRFEEEFNLLEERLSQRLIERLQSERDPQRRDLVYIFPQQFTFLRNIAKRFLDELFQPNRFEQRSLLRGVYFTSATQEGNPIDRLLGKLAGTFGVARQALPSFSGSGRSYFLTKLFNEVIFLESGLAGTNRRLERRRRWLQSGSYVLVAALAVLFSLGWYTSYARNKNFVEDVETQLASLNQDIDALNQKVQNRADDHRTVAAVLPLLNQARAIPGATGEGADTPWLSRLGLSQNHKIGGKAENAYFRLLDRGLLPRLLLDLEETLRDSGENDELLDALTVYLMLDRSAPDRPFEPDTIKNYFDRVWQQAPGIDAEGRQQLATHLDALLARLPNSLPLAPNPDLIQRTRQRLASLPSADRLYARLKQDGLGAEPFRLSQAGGRDVPLVFGRASGANLNAGVSGIFTKAGFEQFSQSSEQTVKALASSNWVLGPQTVSQSDLNQLIQEMRRRYNSDYCPEWRSLLDDITLIRPNNLQDAKTTLSVLAGPDSPLRGLIQGIAAETAVAQDSQSCLKEIIRLTEGEAPTALDQMLTELDEIAVLLAPLAQTEERGEALDKTIGNDVILRLENLASRQPAPISRWLRTLADEISRHLVGGIRAHLDEIWKRDVLAFCQQAINGRFPFNDNSRQDVTLQDFSSFFGPGGMVQRFLNGDIHTFIDTSTTPWRWRSFDNNPGVPERKLVQLQLADQIREVFFPRGSRQPKVVFQLSPLSMEPVTQRFSLDVDGQTLVYQGQAAAPFELRWPGANGFGRVQMQFFPAFDQNRPVGVLIEGPWAWFRALERANLRSTDDPDVFRVTFRAEEHAASFELRAASAFNPFRLNLRRFDCPLSL